MIISSIDIGTNTILLLVAEAKHGKIVKVIHDQQVIARLGEGVDRNRVISNAAFLRASGFLSSYRQTALQLHSDKIVAVGTSALRDAINGKEICAGIAASTGINIEILSGDDEAQWTFFGALTGNEAPGERFTVIDIGGGSTEIISGTSSTIDEKVSLDIGCVRITERMLSPLPPSEHRLAAARKFVADAIVASLPFGVGSSRAIGVAGTVTTLAAINLKLKEYDPSKVHGHVLHKEDIHSAVQFLAMKSIEEIRKIPQVSPGRADVLLAGSIILLEFMEAGNLEEITVSDRGLRYGIVLREIRGMKEGY